MEKLTQKQAIDYFRQHWIILHKNPEVSKYDVVIDGIDVDSLNGGCFLCEYDHQHCTGTKYYCCKFCLIKWPNVSRICDREGSPYLEWIDADTLEEKSRLAKIISELPVNRIKRS